MARHSSQYSDGELAISQILFAPRPKVPMRLGPTANFFLSEVFLLAKVIGVVGLTTGCNFLAEVKITSIAGHLS